MARAQKDILLVIQARDTASRAVDAATDALRTLFEAQGDVGDGAKLTGAKLHELVTAIAAVERANNTVGASFTKAEGAFARQQASIAETKAQLSSVKGQIEGVAAAIVAAQSRIVDTVLSGGDQTELVRQIQAARAALVGLQSQEGRLTASLNAQQSAIGQSRNSLQQLGSTANAVEAALVGVGTETERAMLEAAIATERETKALRDQAAAAREAVAAQASQSRFNGLLGVREPVSGGARASAGVFVEDLDRQARAAQNAADGMRAAGEAEILLIDKAAALKARMDPLAAIQTKLNQELRTARDLYRAGAISAEELALAERVLTRDAKNAADQLNRQGRGEGGKIGMFGLKPYELTNFGYQINDVFTQLASGTNLTQTMAQQGGQLLQLFPRVGAAIVAALGNPIILGAVAGIALLVTGFRKAAEESARLRSFQGLLTSIGNEANYSARELADNADVLDRMGLSAEQATASVRTFLRDGVNPDMIERFGQAARDMADVLGIDVADATRQVSEGLTGNWEAMQRLQQATQFLTAAEAERIRTLYEDGRASQARMTAFALFSRRMEEGANASRGRWAQAARSLEGAWTNMTSRLGQGTTFVDRWIQRFNLLAEVLHRVGQALDGLPDVGAQGAQASAAAQTAQIAQLERNLSRLQSMAAVRNTPQIQGWIRETRQALTQARGAGDTRDPESVRARQQELDMARERARELNLIQLEARLNEIMEVDRRWGEVRNAASRIAISGEIEYQRVLQQTNDDQRRANNARELAEARERVRIATEGRANSAAIGGEVLSSANRFRNRDERNPADVAVLQELFRAANVNIDPRITAWCAAFVNAVLATQGIRGTGSLSARSFSGFGSEVQREDARPGDIVVFRDIAPDRNGRRNPAQGHVGFLTGFDRDGNPRVLGGNQSQRVTEQTFNARDVIGYRRAPGATDQAADVDLERIDRQAQLNERIDQENEQRQRTVAQARELLNLSGDQLFARMRSQAVENAATDAQRQAARQGQEIDAERLRIIRETVGAEWDVANARERATRLVDETSSERQALLDRLEAARAAGDTALMGELTTQIRAVDGALQAAIRSAIQYWQQFDTSEARTAISGLQVLRDGIGRTQEARERQAVEETVQRLQAVRAELSQQISFFQDQGQTSIAEGLRDRVRGLDRELLVATEHMIAFWRSSDLPEAPGMALQFENLRNTIAATRQEFTIAAGQIQQAFAGSLTNAAMEWADAIGSGGNAIRATWDLLRGFASDFLRQIAMMLLQAAALKLAMKLGFGNVASGMNSLLSAAPLVAAGTTLNSAGGKLTVAGGTLTAAGAGWSVVAAQIMAAAKTLLVANAAGSLAGIFHEGGIAGAATVTRKVHPSIFANASRYHRGGIAGLRPGEIPAILERGEEILKRSDARHVLNGGGASGGAGEPNVDVTVVNAIDAGDFVSKGLNTRVGSRAILNYMRSNADTVKAAIGA